MNILDLAVSTESFEVVFTHPATGKDIVLENHKPMSAKVYSCHSGTSEAAFEKMKHKMRALINEDGDIDSEAYAKVYAEAVVDACESIYLDPDFDRDDNIETLVNPEYKWLLKQFTAAMDKHANFMQG